jgi:superfamily I DNA and/or RNA helicase
MITSDEFRSPKDIAYKLQDTQVILCTISMLSHPKISFFTRPVPFNILIIDEASQISTREYLAMLNKQHSSLKRMVFIGDDQQCMPIVSPMVLRLTLFHLSASIWGQGDPEHL